MISKDRLISGNFYIVFLSALVALHALAIDTYLPAVPQMAESYSTNVAAVNLTLSFFLLGGAIGQFFGGALSDQMGRKTVGLFGLFVFAGASIVIPMTGQIEQVYALRFIQAVGSGLCNVTAMAQARDVYPVDQLGKKMANIMLVMLVAPLLAPLIGAGLLQIAWQLIFVFFALFAAACAGIYLWYVPETLQNNIRVPQFGPMLRGYQAVLRHSVDGRLTASRYILFTACSGGVFMSFLTNMSAIFMSHFELGEFAFAFVFTGGSICLMLGNRMASRLMNRKSLLWILRFANGMQVLVFSLLLLLMFLGYGTFSVVVGLLLLTLFFQGAVGPSSSAALMSFFEDNAGSAASLNSTSLFVGGGLIGALATMLAQGSPGIVFATMLVSAAAGRVVLLSIRA